MQAAVIYHHPTLAGMPTLFVSRYEHDMPGVLIPHAEPRLVVRFGASGHDGIDAHVIGARQRVHRKFIRGGMRLVMARLRLGTSETVLGTPASALTGRIVPLEDLWSGAATRRLFDQLANARDTHDAAKALEIAIGQRLSTAKESRSQTQLALHAAEQLMNAHVRTVATGLHMSERHLRRIFRETIGIGPKAFARLARFHDALHAARENPPANWAAIAAETGYYDQAHLIAEFRTIAGMTPNSFLDELDASSAT